VTKRAAAAYEHELEVSLEAGREAAAILLRHYEEGTKTWEKSEDNPVTLADLESDRVIAERIRTAFPDDGLLSEEAIGSRDRLANRRVWIVDPMDGTKEFTRKIPEFCVSIALTEDGVPVVGVIVNPPANVTLWATRGGGTFRDGEPMRISSTDRLADAVVIASRTEISRNQFDCYEGWFREIRPVGSIAWKLACVACGDGDLNISVVPKNEWDVCAGDLLVRESGGRYVDFEGQPRRYNQPKTLIDAGMAAGPNELLEEFFARERARCEQHPGGENQ
jgi:myo-inositol-1(or 4)-monophosphatase